MERFKLIVKAFLSLLQIFGVGVAALLGLSQWLFGFGGQIAAFAFLLAAFAWFLQILGQGFSAVEQM